MTADTDRDWSLLAESDPYFAVLTEERYRTDRLTDDDRAAFYASGEAHVERVLARIRSALDPDFAPRRALDFGCGAGRVVLPLATMVDEVIAVDVAPAMLEAARSAAADRGLTNVSFVLSDDGLSRVTGTFDFVHSFIVLQHIAPARGMGIVHGLLKRVRDHGVLALHVVYTQRVGVRSRVLRWIRARVPFGRALLNIALGRPADAPEMQMHDYPIADLLEALRAAGCHQVALMFSDHGGAMGVMLLARKQSESSL